MQKTNFVKNVINYNKKKADNCLKIINKWLKELDG